MRWRKLALGVVVAVQVAAIAGKDVATAATSERLRSRSGSGYSLVEGVVPGPLVEVVPFRSPTGRRSLVFLVESAGDAAGPRFIYQLRLGDPADLSDLPVVLPPGASSIAVVDLTGDGAGEVLVGEHGRIFLLSGEGKLEVVLEEAGVDLRGRPRGAFAGANSLAGELIVGAVGRVGRYTLEGGKGGLRKLEEYRIPVLPSRRGHWLHLASPLVFAVPRPQAPGGFTYLVGPLVVGERRLRTLVLDIGGLSDGSVDELWSRLPSPEKVEESLYSRLDDEIVLLVTTVQADKRGIFEKEKFRVLRLSEDRSRAGVAPILEVVSRTRNWYRLGMGVHDVDSDGCDDVVLVQPKGLGGGKLVVEAFMGSGNGGFDKVTRRTTLEIETELWSYGEDVDLDGFPDLVLIADEALLVFSGVGGTDLDRVVHEEPTWSVPIGAMDDALTVVDAQGDARPEVLLIERRGRDFDTEMTGSDGESGPPSTHHEKPVRGRFCLVTFTEPVNRPRLNR